MAGYGVFSKYKWGGRGVTLGILCIFSLQGYSAESGTKAVSLSPGEPLSLKLAVEAAQKNDPWLKGNLHSQNAIESLSVAAGTLPDPKISVGLVSLPVDTASFGQEGMTQFKVGVSQVFPRGDSLAIRQEQLEQLGRQHPYQRKNRKAKVVVMASQLWLNAYKAQEAIKLIEIDRPLFLQLVDVVEAGYSSALGRSRQQDLVRAQLELTRLDDRLTVLNKLREKNLQNLTQWIGDYFVGEYSALQGTENILQSVHLKLDPRMPDVNPLQPLLYGSEKAISPQLLFGYLEKHPAVMAVEQKIEASLTGIRLAKQKYKPEWGVNAGYGYRGDDAVGATRADLFSMGVTFDVPIFTTNKQDKETQSAIYQSESVKTEKWLLVRQFIASFEANKAELRRLNERLGLYHSKLLPQMHDQAEASLTAYTNDDGDFAEVIRARIAELNANIDELNINVEKQKVMIQLNYFFMKNADEIVSNRRVSGEIK